MKQLSIIIPHHNTPDLLDRLLDSIPYSDDVEIIVIDDNSDPTIVNFSELVKRERPGLSIVLTKEGRGAGYARNVGLSKATGQWLLFADSDDFFINGFLDIVAKHFNDESDMVLFKAKSVDSDTLLPAKRNENINKQIDGCLAGRISAKDASVVVQSPWCRLIRRSLVVQHGILFDEVLSCNDTMFTTKCTCLAQKIDVSQEEIYVVTYRAGSLWTSRKNNPKNYLTRLKVQIERNKYVKDFGYDSVPIFLYVLRGWHVSIPTFWKAVWIAVSKRALFQGFSSYFK